MQYALTCFLIDNDEEDQEIFEMALSEIDPNIVCFFANNGVDALKKLNSDIFFIPSFIFIDMNMPLMNGTQCLEEIKKIHRLKHVPIYIYSTAADPQSIAKVKLLGAANFIIKPASIKGLTNLLSKLFQLQKSLSL